MRRLLGVGLLVMVSGCGRVGFAKAGAATDDVSAGDGGAARMDGVSSMDPGSAEMDAAATMDAAVPDGADWDAQIPEDGAPDGAVLQPVPGCPTNCNGGCWGYYGYRTWYSKYCYIRDPPPGTIDCGSGFSCRVQCSTAGSCAGPYAAGGTRLSFTCSGDDSCSGSIDCSGGGCTLVCSGLRSCSGNIQSGTEYLNVTCDGVESCGGTIDCASSCRCTTTCRPDSSCSAVCPSGCTATRGCRSNGGCDSC